MCLSGRWFDRTATTSSSLVSGQDYEQTIVARDLPAKRIAENFINENGVVFSYLRWFQLLGKYYIKASVDGSEGLGFRTLHPQTNEAAHEKRTKTLRCA